MCVRPGATNATDLSITPDDAVISSLPGGAPLKDIPGSWNRVVALRVDMAVLEQVEAMEDKVANASMQVKVIFIYTYIFFYYNLIWRTAHDYLIFEALLNAISRSSFQMKN